jgi:hypothetical protein
MVPEHIDCPSCFKFVQSYHQEGQQYQQQKQNLYPRVSTRTNERTLTRENRTIGVARKRKRGKGKSPSLAFPLKIKFNFFQFLP